MLTAPSSPSNSRCMRVAAGAALVLLLLVTLVASGSASRQLDPQERFVSEAELIQQQEQKMLAEEQKMMEQDAGRDDAGRDQASALWSDAMRPVAGGGGQHEAAMRVKANEQAAAFLQQSGQ
mmetsp:Transcript_16685/g.54344  ORF Transcript_16685/g.54344 Transcript_16685/m.54344 type:complete len:122 (-) Transcript_16685:24-389(-)